MASFLDGGDPALRSDPNYRLSVSRVLGRTFSIWLGNLPSFSLLAFVVMVPSTLCLVAPLLGYGDGQSASTLANLLDRILIHILTGAVTYGVFQELHGHRATLGANLAAGFSKLGTVFGVAFVSGLATAVGLCALIIPGLVIAVMYWVAVPVAVVEARGVNDSLVRSAALTKGSRWAIFGVSLVVEGGMILAMLLLATIVTAVGPEGRDDLLELATSVVITPLLSLAAIAPVVTYHDLRVGKEGADIEELVKVFD